MRLSDRRFGPGHPVLVIAELSGNHNGSQERALALLRAAKEAGADAVKLQTYTADTITMDGDGPWFRIEGGPWHGRRLHELYQEASTPWAWHAGLFAEAARLGLPCFSTPFDPSSVDFLESLACPCYKVASFEVVDIPLLQRIAATRKPVIMSSGMASLDELDLAVATLRGGGCPELALLSCVSAYPAPPREMHLANIPALAARYDCIAGLSDHSPGHLAAVAAVALGAQVIEKHLCLARADGGPDAGFSLEPGEFATLMQAVRDTEAACRGPAWGPGTADAGNVIFRKSLFSACDIPAGKRLEPADVRCIRPGHGLPPRELPRVIGKVAKTLIPRATPLAWELFR